MGILKVVLARPVTIILTALCVTALASVIAYTLPTSYSASAQVLFDPHKNKIIDPSGTASDVENDPVSAQNQLRILTSRNLVERVVEKLDLASNPELNPTLSQERPSSLSYFGTGARTSATVSGASPDQVVDAVLRRLSVQPLGLSTVFAITFTSRDPRIASSVANAMADAYIDNQLETKARAALAAESWLRQRVTQLAIDSQNAEAALQNYKKTRHLSEVVDGTPLVDQELAAVQSQLVLARATLSQKRAVQNALHKLAATDSVADLSQVSLSPEIVQLRQQEAEIMRQEADLATQYGPKYPKRVGIESERKNIEDKLSEAIARVARSTDVDVVVAQSEVDALQTNLMETENRAVTQNIAQSTLLPLEVNAKSAQAAYEAFVLRLQDLEGQKAMLGADASVISRAPVPMTANPPRRSLLVLASLPAGLLLGLILAMLKQRVAPASNRSLRSLRLDAPVLARLPRDPAQGLSNIGTADLVETRPASQFARAIKDLDRLIGAQAGQTRVIGFLSPAPDQTKTLVAISVARTAARRGLNVLLIDADRTFGLSARPAQLSPGQGGLAEVLGGTKDLARCVMRDPLSMVTLLSSRSGDDTTSLMGSDKMVELVIQLRRSWDMVILNFPPEVAPKALYQLSRLVEGMVVILTNVQMTQVEEANSLISGLQNTQVGLVLAG